MLGQFFERLRPIESGPEKNSVDLLYAVQLLRAESLALETDLVEGANHRWAPVGDKIRRDVLNHLGASAHHGKSTDSTELVHACHRSKGNMIFHEDVARQGNGIARHDMVPQPAIMRHVPVGQQRVVVPDQRIVAVVGRGVHGHVFSKHVARADANAGISPLVLQILSFRADIRVRKNFTIRAELGVTFDARVMMDLRARAHPHFSRQVGERTDLNVRAELHTRFDDCGRMYSISHDGQSEQAEGQSSLRTLRVIIKERNLTARPNHCPSLQT